MPAHQCRSCESAVDHCHGTLIAHLGRLVECTEEDCADLDQARHTFIVDCADIAGGCSCYAAHSAARTG
ncbi:hypothetical protein [Nocardia arthritidis]|uniref:Uncharacterized protein n=1 Tax=Nocardia arthritidis TaxID=228602 RepID=A0A6G9Y4V9_9NOCA|nr:hypothetical protein [Nocardia arthritidis]QIS08239.1 hypothetical protein F5544_01585 [Nocardia arthritidis]